MIVTEAYLRVALGLESSITDAEQAMLSVIHPQAEAAVIEFLGYDPKQRVYTEFYPRGFEFGGAGIDEVVDVNASGTRAVVLPAGAGRKTLQMAVIPVRSVSAIYEDTSARFGQQSGDFAAATLLTEGDDYYVELDQENYGRSGLIHAVGAWPLRPGTVKITYRAGYSPNELAGRATASETDDNGNISTNGVNASGISRAVMLTVLNAFQTYAGFKKKATTGFTAGPFQSERLGDYSYTLGSAGGTQNAAAVGSLTIQLPPEAQEAAESFQHYGIMRT